MGEFDPLRYLVNDLNSSAYRGVSRAYLTELARDPEVRQALYPALKEPGVTKDEKTGLAEVLAASGAPDALAPWKRSPRIRMPTSRKGCGIAGCRKGPKRLRAAHRRRERSQTHKP